MGKLVYSDGSTYTGMYKAHKREGKGKFDGGGVDNAIKDGVWKTDAFLGKDTISPALYFSNDLTKDEKLDWDNHY